MEFSYMFNDKYYRNTQYDGKYSNNQNNHHLFKESSKYDKYNPKYDRHYVSQSTLCVPHRPRLPSKSTVCAHPHQMSPSKSTLCSPYHHRKEEHIMEKNVSTLPYYIVPVLYVPHKPLYDAKKIIEPHVYKAYHCKSKSHLQKNAAPKLSRSKSILSLYNRRKFEEGKYSFEHYDEYFSKYMEGRKSSSEISFCTEKSYAHLPPTPKTSRPENYDLCSEKRKSISRNFPELFGSYEDTTRKFDVEEPTWDSPRTIDAFIETETTSKSCTSQQTSLETLKQDTKTDSQGTQTLIKDIKKNVLVVSSDRFGRSRREPPVETPENIDDPDGKILKAKLSDEQLEKVARKTFGFNRNIPRFTVSKLTKSAVPNPCGGNRKVTRTTVQEDED